VLLIICNIGPAIRWEFLPNLLKTVKNCGVKYEFIINFNGGGSLEALGNAIRNATILHNKGENIGNAKGLNQCLRYAMLQDIEFTHIAVIADDIDMPIHWGKKAIAFEAENTGLMGFHCVQAIGHQIALNVWKPQRVFGCWVFNAKWIKKVGYFLDNLSNYGIWDAEYNRRIEASGGVNLYIGRSQHLEPSQSNSEYRKFKNAELKKASEALNQLSDNSPITYYDPFRN
jgi:hypothetical protein